MQVRFREFIPSILNVSRQCLAIGEEDVAVIAFEIFDELIESPAPLLGDSVKSIVQFSLEVCSNQNLEPSTRHQVREESHILNLIISRSFWFMQLLSRRCNFLSDMLMASTSFDLGLLFLFSFFPFDIRLFR